MPPTVILEREPSRFKRINDALGLESSELTCRSFLVIFWTALLLACSVICMATIKTATQMATNDGYVTLWCDEVNCGAAGQTMAEAKTNLADCVALHTGDTGEIVIIVQGFKKDAAFLG